MVYAKNVQFIDKKAETIKAVENLLRVGVVTDINPDTGQVRVKYPGMDFTSGWLGVLQHAGTPVTVERCEKTEHEHGHEARLGRWLPAVNDTVLVLYVPFLNGDGYVLGGL